MRQRCSAAALAGALCANLAADARAASSDYDDERPCEESVKASGGTKGSGKKGAARGSAAKAGNAARHRTRKGSAERGGATTGDVKKGDDDHDVDAEGSGDADAGGCEPSFEASLSLFSAYVFRGFNVFQNERQDEQNWVLKPRVVWSDATNRLDVGYTSIYQVSGENLWENVDDGVGSDQVLFVDYDFPLSDRLILSPEIDLYAYPQAHDVPLFLEPSAELRYLGPLKGIATLSYFGALRSGPQSEDYFYLSAQVEKAFHVTKKLELGVQASAGVKFFTSHLDTIGDNMFDVLVSETAYYDITDALFVGLKLAMAWTNLGAHKDPETGRTVDTGFIDGVAPFWGLVVGVDL